jgi:hypothetical protein
LRLPPPKDIFLKNNPEIACQAQGPSNQFTINNTHVIKFPARTAIIEIEGKKSGKPDPKGLGFLLLTQRNEDFTSRGLDCKDFTTA